MFDPEVLERFMRKRYGAITRARDLMESGEDLCITVTGKPGQKRMDLARDLKEEASRKGSDVGMVHMDLLTPMKFRSLGYKICCSTACPRIAMDDSDQYLLEGVTLLTPTELRIALGLMSWDDYELDEEW
jgi:2-(3-amino-3-carboxypropyl)histidine synthase